MYLLSKGDIMRSQNKSCNNDIQCQREMYKQNTIIYEIIHRVMSLQILLILFLSSFLFCMPIIAHALDASCSAIVIDGYGVSVWTVEGKTFKLTGNQHKTIKTKEGQYTFYADGTYHKGTKDMRKYCIKISGKHKDKQGSWENITITEIGTYMCKISSSSGMHDEQFHKIKLDISIKEKKCFGIIKKKTPLLQKGTKKAKKITDCQEGDIVLIISKGKTYSKVNTVDYQGYIANSNLNFVEPVNSAESITIYGSKKPVQTYFSPDTKSKKAYSYKKDIVVFCIADDGKWCTIEKGGKRFYVLRKQTSLADKNDEVIEENNDLVPAKKEQPKENEKQVQNTKPPALNILIYQLFSRGSTYTDCKQVIEEKGGIISDLHSSLAYIRSPLEVGGFPVKSCKLSFSYNNDEENIIKDQDHIYFQSVYCEFQDIGAFLGLKKQFIELYGDPIIWPNENYIEWKLDGATLRLGGRPYILFYLD